MGKCVTCRGLHILENDNSKINHSCVSPRMGCLEYQDVSIKVYLTYCSDKYQLVQKLLTLSAPVEETIFSIAQVLFPEI